MDKYYSKTYKGFLIQQSEKGWDIPMLPNWASFGPVSKPPYGTYQIACHVVDLILQHSK